MAKNRAILQVYKRELEFMNRMTPEMLSAFAVALKRYTELSNEDIEYLVDQTQVVWNEANDKGVMPSEFCKNEVGLDYYKETDKARAGQ